MQVHPSLDFARCRGTAPSRSFHPAAPVSFFPTHRPSTQLTIAIMDTCLDESPRVSRSPPSAGSEPDPSSRSLTSCPSAFSVSSIAW